MSWYYFFKYTRLGHENSRAVIGLDAPVSVVCQWNVGVLDVNGGQISVACRGHLRWLAKSAKEKVLLGSGNTLKKPLHFKMATANTLSGITFSGTHWYLAEPLYAISLGLVLSLQSTWKDRHEILFRH